MSSTSTPSTSTSSTSTSSTSDTLLEKIFLTARSANGFLDKPVAPAVLREIYDVAKLGPTSMNTQPARYLFLTTPAAKARLIPALMAGNVDKTLAAPVTVIVATDNRFHDFMPEVFPNNPNASAMFEGNAALATDTRIRNGTLGGAYFMIAARALGLDCGPLSGFDTAKVDAEFFADGRWRANFLLNLGYGDPSKAYPRNPRLTFEQATRTI